MRIQEVVPFLPRFIHNWAMRKPLFLLFFLLCAQATAQTEEPLNFSILGEGCLGQVSGFLNNGSAANPAPGGGLWFGISLGDQWDGLFGLDYYTMPNQPVTVNVAPTTANGFVSYEVVQPTDDFALTLNARWYWDKKYDRIHQRFNAVPYLLVGGGMDLVVDQYPPPVPNPGFYGKSFDILFSMNAGAGMDFPLFDGKQWFLYVEGMDHLIAWQGLTQVMSGRIGFKVMLDSAHADPFRGVF